MTPLLGERPQPLWRNNLRPPAVGTAVAMVRGMDYYRNIAAQQRLAARRKRHVIDRLVVTGVVVAVVLAAVVIVTGGVLIAVPTTPKTPNPERV